jgi:hypothetical protein
VTDQIFRIISQPAPLVATAIHDGSEVREQVLRHMVLDEASRRREEDPFTGQWTRIAPTRVVGLRSRFEVDLNRPREQAVYRTPEDSWGLQVWDGSLPDDVAAESLVEYDVFHEALREVYAGLAERYGRFVVFDLHSYNHRRGGPDGPVADESQNPMVNVGTGTMKDRSRWAGIIERFKHDLGCFDFPGGKLDVRENVRFFGGNHPRWAHHTFPDSACVLAIEFKKFFMDEWTGEADWGLVEAIGEALASTVPGVLEELAKL